MAGVLLVVGSVTVSVAADGQIPLIDALDGVILLAAGVAAVVAVVVGVRRLVRRGLVWWCRTMCLLLTVVSGSALVLAVQYDNAHRYPDGMATEVGQLAMVAALFALLAGVSALGRLSRHPPRQNWRT